MKNNPLLHRVGKRPSRALPGWTCAIVFALMNFTAEASGLALRNDHSLMADRTTEVIAEKTITGQVIDSETNEGLPGASILIKGTTQGTTTDANGKYTLIVPDDAVLVVSFIGYLTQEITVGTATTINISMKPDVTRLSDVVVVGYGIMKKSEVLGSVGSVSIKESGSRTYNNAGEMLQGTVAGVTVLNNGGDPTASPNINIRGIGSINGEEPLIILDGVIYAGSLATINPDDIATISVLKDAASAAIYGARASGGVILITSKQGKTDQVKVDINFQQGVQQVAKKLKPLDAAGQADAINTATDNAGLPRIPAFNVALEPTARTTKTRWMDEIFQTGKITNLAVSLSGGSKRSKFFMSGSYRRNEGILLNTFANRYTAKINSTHQLYPNLTIGENVSFSLNDGQTGNTSSAYTGAILSALLYPSNATVYREDGSGRFGGVPEQYPSAYGDLINPVAYLKRLDNRNPESTILINPFLEWEIIKGLKFRSNWGITRMNRLYREFQTKVPEPGKIFDYNQLTEETYTFNDLLSEQTLAYEKTIKEHDFKALVGYTYQKTKMDEYGIVGSGFISEAPSFRYMENASSITAWGGQRQYEYYLISYLARLSYVYQGKYMFSGIMRRDGTSRLIAANRWQVYPSVSLGWLVSEENFMKGATLINNLKLRASYGEIGNLGALNPYSFSVNMNKTTSLLGESPVFNFGYAENELSNSSLVWESSRQSNVGIDFGLWSNRLTGTVDVFNKTNSKMLFNEALPGVAGAPEGRTINAGSVKNTGTEVSLTYNKREGAVTFDFTLNYSYISNKVTELYNNLDLLINENSVRVRNLPYSNVFKLGAPVNAFYGYQTDGIFKTNEEAINYVNGDNVRYQSNATAGDLRFKDTNGDGVINDKDRVILGSPFPKNTFGFNSNIRFKSFDINLFFQGVSGNKILNGVKYLGLNSSVSTGYNLLDEVRNAWSPQNPNSDIPKLNAKDPNNNFGRISDFYLEDASFLRLRNVTVGYTVKHPWLENKASVRVYLTGQNLFTITNYSGMDPEIGLVRNGVDLGRYPLARIYMAGIQVGL